MEDNINWQLASNSQLKEECERLEKEFNETQEELKTYVSKIEEFNGLGNVVFRKRSGRLQLQL